jgi:2-methylcitrate dehydratase PrpD
MTQPLTAAYGAFIAQLRYKALPAEAVGVIKQGFTDCIGVMLAGSREPVAVAVERVLRADQTTGTSNLYFTRSECRLRLQHW